MLEKNHKIFFIMCNKEIQYITKNSIYFINPCTIVSRRVAGISGSKHICGASDLKDQHYLSFVASFFLTLVIHL